MNAEEVLTEFIAVSIVTLIVSGFIASAMLVFYAVTEYTLLYILPFFAEVVIVSILGTEEVAKELNVLGTVLEVLKVSVDAVSLYLLYTKNVYLLSFSVFLALLLIFLRCRNSQEHK